MKCYYTGYSCCGWIPNPSGGGEWKHFVSDKEYEEAYAEEAAPLYFSQQKQGC